MKSENLAGRRYRKYKTEKGSRAGGGKGYDEGITQKSDRTPPP